MFGKKKDGVEKLSGPKEVPAVVEKYLVTEKKLEPDMVHILKALIRRNQKDGDRTFDIRIFDTAEAAVEKVEVKDYTSLDQHPNLVIYDGWYDDNTKEVQLQEKKKLDWTTTLFTEAEIRKKIEDLSQPGSTTFFYLARGTKYGGPLGRGAAVIELNPTYPGKGKKYNIYMADVDGLEAVGKGEKLWDSKDPKRIAQWVKDAHHKRMF